MQSQLEATLAKLIQYDSITPHDKGCQDWLIEELQQIGFSCEKLPKNNVSNFFATIGDSGPCLGFAGHTDVVTVGNATQWQFPPFELSSHENFYYGRGVADMKGSIAAFLCACKTFLKKKADFDARIAWLITSAEEGEDYLDGTPVIMSHIHDTKYRIEYCIVGEPSASEQVGDVVRIGRRGSISAYLKIKGIQGHVAYPDLADNPIHRAGKFLSELNAVDWDQGNDFFPKTTLQVSYISSGEPESGNVIPGETTIHFNLRYSTELNADMIQTRILDLIHQHQFDYEIHWKLSGDPFLTKSGALIDTVQKSIETIQNIKPELSTAGGTSDGRFIAPHGIEVVELGLCNESIHQVNEKIRIASLEQLYQIYLNILETLFSS